MKIVSLILFAALALVAQPPDPDDATKTKIVEAVRAKALAYAKDLPDFECRQVTRRNEDPKGLNQWKTLETVNEQLTYINGKEEYRTIAVNGKKSSSDGHAPVMRASDFADFLSWVFDPAVKADIGWSKWDGLRGHRVHELGFRVTKDNSKYVITKGKGQQATAGMFGLIDADSESYSVLKLGIVATDVPANFPIQGTAIELHFEFVKLGEHYYLLPQKADIHGKEGKMLTWTEVEYHDFKKLDSK